MAVYSPTNQFLAQFKKIITSFIWNDKTSKIAYKKLIQQYSNNGLKLVDLKTKDLSLKAWL